MLIFSLRPGGPSMTSSGYALLWCASLCCLLAAMAMDVSVSTDVSLESGTDRVTSQFADFVSTWASVVQDSNNGSDNGSVVIRTENMTSQGLDVSTVSSWNLSDAHQESVLMSLPTSPTAGGWNLNGAASSNGQIPLHNGSMGQSVSNQELSTRTLLSILMNSFSSEAASKQSSQAISYLSSIMLSSQPAFINASMLRDGSNQSSPISPSPIQGSLAGVNSALPIQPSTVLQAGEQINLSTSIPTDTRSLSLMESSLVNDSTRQIRTSSATAAAFSSPLTSAEVISTSSVGISVSSGQRSLSFIAASLGAPALSMPPSSMLISTPNYSAAPFSLTQGSLLTSMPSGSTSPVTQNPSQSGTPFNSSRDAVHSSPPTLGATSPPSLTSITTAVQSSISNWTAVNGQTRANATSEARSSWIPSSGRSSLVATSGNATAAYSPSPIIQTSFQTHDTQQNVNGSSSRTSGSSGDSNVSLLTTLQQGSSEPFSARQSSRASLSSTAPPASTFGLTTRLLSTSPTSDTARYSQPFNASISTGMKTSGTQRGFSDTVSPPSASPSPARGSTGAFNLLLSVTLRPSQSISTQQSSSTSSSPAVPLRSLFGSTASVLATNPANGTAMHSQPLLTGVSPDTKPPATSQRTSYTTRVSPSSSAIPSPGSGSSGGIKMSPLSTPQQGPSAPLSAQQSTRTFLVMTAKPTTPLPLITSSQATRAPSGAATYPQPPTTSVGRGMPTSFPQQGYPATARVSPGETSPVAKLSSWLTTSLRTTARYESIASSSSRQTAKAPPSVPSTTSFRSIGTGLASAKFTSTAAAASKATPTVAQQKIGVTSSAGAPNLSKPGWPVTMPSSRSPAWLYPKSEIATVSGTTVLTSSRPTPGEPRTMTQRATTQTSSRLSELIRQSAPQSKTQTTGQRIGLASSVSQRVPVDGAVTASSKHVTQQQTRTVMLMVANSFSRGAPSTGTRFALASAQVYTAKPFGMPSTAADPTARRSPTTGRIKTTRSTLKPQTPTQRPYASIAGSSAWRSTIRSLSTRRSSMATKPSTAKAVQRVISTPKPTPFPYSDLLIKLHNLSATLLLADVKMEDLEEELQSSPLVPAALRAQLSASPFQMPPMDLPFDLSSAVVELDVMEKRIHDLIGRFDIIRVGYAAADAGFASTAETAPATAVSTAASTATSPRADSPAGSGAAALGATAATVSADGADQRLWWLLVLPVAGIAFGAAAFAYRHAKVAKRRKIGNAEDVEAARNT